MLYPSMSTRACLTCGSASDNTEPAGACAASSGSSRRAGGIGAGGGRFALPIAGCGAQANGLTMWNPCIGAGAAAPAPDEGSVNFVFDDVL